MKSLTTAGHHLGIFPVLSEIFHLWQIMSAPEKLSDFGCFQILKFQTKDTQSVFTNEACDHNLDQIN